MKPDQHWQIDAISKEIAPGETAIVDVCPQILFRSDKCETTPGFTVENVEIHNFDIVDGGGERAPKSQLEAFHNGTSFDTCYAFGRIVFTVRNLSQEPAVFRAAMKGRAVLNRSIGEI